MRTLGTSKRSCLVMICTAVTLSVKGKAECSGILSDAHGSSVVGGWRRRIHTSLEHFFFFFEGSCGCVRETWKPNLVLEA